jgi:hypothetical protein
MMKPAWAAETIRSLSADARRRLVVVDNSADGLGRRAHKLVTGTYLRNGQNLGCAASWNVGAAIAETMGADHLTMLSEAVTFQDGGELWETMLAPEPVGLAGPNIWHLYGLHLDTLKATGPFDDGFWPIYYEDTDYERRMALLGLWPRWDPRVALSYTDRGHAHTWKDGWIAVDYDQQGRRYTAKWGGMPGHETFTRPWGYPAT